MINRRWFVEKGIPKHELPKRLYFIAGGGRLVVISSQTWAAACSELRAVSLQEYNSNSTYERLLRAYESMRADEAQWWR